MCKIKLFYLNRHTRVKNMLGILEYEYPTSLGRCFSDQKYMYSEAILTGIHLMYVYHISVK